MGRGSSGTALHRACEALKEKIAQPARNHEASPLCGVACAFFGFGEYLVNMPTEGYVANPC